MTTLDDNPNQLDLNLPGLGPDTIFAGAGADLIRTATLGGSLIFGEGDNDTLISVGPNDTLYGGADEDSIRSQRTPALLYGDAGSDTIVAEARATIVGGQGDDFLQGTVEANLMFGNQDNDTMLGGAQRRDSLYGGKGNDSLGFFIAGGGNNLGLPLFGTGFAGNEGSNYLRGDLGDDLVVGINVRDSLFGGRGNDSLRGAGSSSYLSGDLDNDTLWVPNATQTSPFSVNVLTVGLEKITLLGGAGNDSLYGSIGNAGEGRNFLEGGDGNDTIKVFATQDTALGGAGNDFIVSSTVTNVISTSGAPSSFPGFAGRNLLDGGADNDTIVAAFSTDTMIGGAGNDSLSGIFTQGSGGEGNDTINASFGGTSATLVTLNGGLGDDLLIGNTTVVTGFTVTNFFNGGEGNDRMIFGTARDNVIGDASGNDTISYATGVNFNLNNNTVVNVITDTLGSNFITGGNGTDVITTGAGDDILFGGQTIGTTPQLTDGNDTLDAGGGNDTLLGDFGNDQLFGGDGNDSIGGGPGADTLIGGSGNDSFYYANFGEGVIGVGTTSSADQIGDFISGQDKFVFNRAGFPGLTGGNQPAFESFLQVNQSYSNNATPQGASTSQPFIFYQINDGRLGFDPDGSGGANPGVTLAILNNRPTITASDIVLI
ncbi:MAG: calcium-binding protein [Microcoleus sp. CSU_2_2]|nr:calcium-binding protein [Microcoleus sp. SU_5_3]NJS11195.1 calcium-binding protein [Microcoleus sp. CSU_2_2]